ncbi:MAG: hypothetical protein ACC628_26695 [Pirellulaceae bacterium]
MMATKEELLRRADVYVQRHGLLLGEPLGFVFMVSFLSQKARPNRGARLSKFVSARRRIAGNVMFICGCRTTV